MSKERREGRLQGLTEAAALLRREADKKKNMKISGSSLIQIQVKSFEFMASYIEAYVRDLRKRNHTS